MLDARRKRLIWAVTILVSALLFFLGVVKPLKTQSDVRGVERALRASPTPWETRTQQARLNELRADAFPNYYLGVVLPVGLIGLAAIACLGPAMGARPGSREITPAQSTALSDGRAERWAMPNRSK